LSYRVGGESLAGWHGLTVSSARGRAEALVPRDPQGRLVQKELLARLRYLEAVGLGYLALDRQARTLSGGGAQRAAVTTARAGAPKLWEPRDARRVRRPRVARRPRAQPEGGHRAHPARRGVGDHRAERIRQEHARRRRAVSRGGARAWRSRGAAPGRARWT